MFSISNFYNILANNILNPLKIHYWYFYPYGTFNLKNVTLHSHINHLNGSLGVFFWDQEPFHTELFNKTIYSNADMFIPKNLIIANSDTCQETKIISNYNWNYFFHGFAALDWYRDLYYLNDMHSNFDKVFISVNRIVTQERSYRLSLVAKLKRDNLLQQGLVSCQLQDSNQELWKNELLDTQSQLTSDQKIEIYKNLQDIKHNLTLDKHVVKGSDSAVIDNDQRSLFQQAFCHVVTETVYYPNKLHLTEKIFRPIVYRRPFLLAGCKGNLQYLKKYGFETFADWWNEDYDLENDADLRLEKIVAIITKLCNYTIDDLKDMHNQMRPVLEHNYNHFYHNFRKILVNEMIDNFETNIQEWNSANKLQYDLKKIDLRRLRLTLSS